MKLSGKGSEKAPEARDLIKAKKFFEHAQTVADARNYDYAIDCYINGFRHDPANIVKLEQLYEVACRRKVANGKPASLMERMKPVFGSPLEKMLNAERIWAKDPLNLSLMVSFMAKAVDADAAEEEINLREVAFWIGSKVLEGNQSSRRPNISDLVRLRDLFTDVGAWEKAVETCKLAIDFASDSQKELLMDELKDLEAELSVQAQQQRGEEGRGSWEDNVKDLSTQRKLDSGDQVAKDEGLVDKEIVALRESFNEDPQNEDTFRRFMKALITRGTETTEGEAMALLNKAYNDTNNYRYKVQASDVKMRQFNRKLRELKEKVATDDDAGKQYIAVRKEQAAFELAEFEDRVANYPTDMRFRFEYGRRLYDAKKTEEAIAQFQEAISDMKLRSVARQYLGLCYNQLQMFDEAIDSFRQAIAEHPSDDDKLGLELRYMLMDALTKKAVSEKALPIAEEALKLGSFILQKNIKYRDIRDRVSKLRTMVEKLRKTAANNA